MRFFVLLALSTLGGVAHAASFDCSKASTPTEKVICASPRVSELDEYLGRYYSAARAELSRAGACLVPDQRNWLRSVRNACKDAACLESAYLARLAELDPLQPGMTALKNLDLPAGKALTWIIAPEADTVAAPPPTRHDPLVVTGTLVDDAAGGNGFLVQDAKGTKFIVLFAMFIDKANGVVLESLSREKSSTYEVRGERQVSGDGSSHFAPGACTFIYRLPHEAPAG